MIAPPPVLPIHGATVPAGPHRGHEVHVQGRLPSGLVVAEHEAARVVHQDVDASERGTRGLEKAVERLGVPHVADPGVHGHRPTTQLGFGLAQRRLTAGADRDTRSLIRQAKHNRPADAATRPGHDC